MPLLVLTADRPHELRDVGAPQTIDQIRLYGSHAKWFVDMAVPEVTADLLRQCAVAAPRRAVATAVAAPAGPVHLNFPFREPLVPGRTPDVRRRIAAAWRARAAPSRHRRPAHRARPRRPRYRRARHRLGRHARAA